MRAKDGTLAKFVRRLIAAAKKRACVVGALMHKRMELAVAILRSGKHLIPITDPPHLLLCEKTQQNKKITLASELTISGAFRRTWNTRKRRRPLIFTHKSGDGGVCARRR
jgi:hypothetical protein